MNWRRGFRRIILVLAAAAAIIWILHCVGAENLPRIGWLIIACVGYFCGVRQGENDKINNIKDKINDIIRKKRIRHQELSDAAMKLLDYNEDKFICSPHDDSKRTRLDSQQSQGDARASRKRLSRKIKKLENEIAWMESLYK